MEEEPIQAVEIRPAYQWTCEECGRDQFESATIIAQVDENNHGYDGLWIIEPEEVQCSHCSVIFETISFDETDDEEWY